MHRRTLNGREKVLWREHPDTLWSTRILALNAAGPGQEYEAAEEVNRQAIEGKKLLEPGHPDTLLLDSILAID